MNDGAALLHDRGTAVRPPTTISPMDALAYEAPFLIEKLLKDHVVQTSEEAEILFSEVKRYIVLTQVDTSKIWEMYSLRIDEAWHQFILFTTQYADFCRRFFGRYVHHSPSNAPEARTAKAVPVASFPIFSERYEELFGSSLPDVWYDERSVTTDRRVLNERAGGLKLRRHDDTIDLVSSTGEVLVTVNELAFEALTFVAQTGTFYVRELPGELTAAEKVALIATLVEYRILRVAA